jgi:hypothetical protein
MSRCIHLRPLNDVLKSVTVLDLNGGRITNIA